jgi:hypothetical protein
MTGYFRLFNTGRDSTLHFTITHTNTIVSTVTSSLPLLGSDFQRRTFRFLSVPELYPASATSFSRLNPNSPLTTQSQSYFKTGSLLPISSSWRAAYIVAADNASHLYYSRTMDSTEPDTGITSASPTHTPSGKTAGQQLRFHSFVSVPSPSRALPVYSYSPRSIYFLPFYGMLPAIFQCLYLED